jgi:hypothetical protein
VKCFIKLLHSTQHSCHDNCPKGTESPYYHYQPVHINSFAHHTRSYHDSQTLSMPCTLGKCTLISEYHPAPRLPRASRQRRARNNGSTSMVHLAYFTPPSIIISLPSSMSLPSRYYISASFLSISSSVIPMPRSISLIFATLALAPVPEVSGVAASIRASRPAKL